MADPRTTQDVESNANKNAGDARKPGAQREFLSEPAADFAPGAHRPGIDETSRRRERAQWMRDLNRARRRK